MKQMRRFFQSLAGRAGVTGEPSPDSELQGLLDELDDSPELLLRELEERPDCPDDEAFSRFLSGRCDREEKQQILDHITTCYPCLATVDDLTREARAQAERERQRVPAPARSERPSRGWAWGLSLGTPVAALCVLLVIVFTGPSLEMDLEVMRSTLRSEASFSVDEGGRLHEGDSFRMEISARRDGFLFLYAWNELQGGKFIFPVPENPDNNRIGKGQTLFIPDEQGWRLVDAVPGDETLFLLFSPHPVGRDALSRVENELKHAGMGLSTIERHLKNEFSLEQRFTYSVE